MIIVKRAGRRRPGHVSVICGLSLTFNPRRVGGQQVFCTEVADDHPRAMDVQQFAQAHPSYEVIDGQTVPLAPMTPESIAASDARSSAPGELAAPVAAALANGWSTDDLDGAGQNDDYGPGGGLSPVTGLTMGQMALSRPPDNWSELRTTKYPWECTDWKAPGQGFKAPSAPAKVPAVAKTAEVVEPEPEVEPTVDDDAVEKPSPSSEETEEAPSDTPDSPEADGEADDDDKAATWAAASEDDPAVIAGYPADQVNQARAIAVALVEARGEIPHPNAINYQLRKADLKTVGKAERDALLSLPE